ncbi:phage portal protein [Microbacterium sp. cx-55]|uniref:phage portal protein n=1 Tax=Microbacterium sp. cx-55 TaxID=2875948 RepID=UPI001CC118E5|nr:phage portal protein [Microbacterium sp. cx-55]MBZ4485968.1 phage portal protein [Microbacterium sp. cx-55]UGB34158.1 phage portal protein [Microbacterium sp. cx-55]
MGFLDWLWSPTETPSQRSEDAPTTPAGPVIPSRDRGLVGASEALGLGAVYRAVSIRATALRQLSLDVERGGQTIDRPLVIRRPNDDMTLGAFLEATVNSRSLAGNAYWRIYRDAAGAVNSLDVLNPREVTIETSASGRVTGYRYRGDELKPTDVAHLPKMRVPGTPYGLGPIEAARNELRGAIDLSTYASEWINSGEMPSGILSFSGYLGDEEAAVAKQRFKDAQGGRRDVVALPADARFDPILVKPADAQFIESQNWNTTAIARLFGVPSSLMLVSLDGNSQTYANVGQEWLAFIRFGLADDIREIEDAFTSILPRGQRARFNTEAFLRLDTTTRYAAHEAGIRAGWLLPSEVRQIEGLDAIDGIDDRAPKISAPATKEAAA